MIKPYLQVDPPVDAQRVSSEQTLAKLDEFCQMLWLPSGYEEGTLKGVRTVESYWHRYEAPLFTHISIN